MLQKAQLHRVLLLLGDLLLLLLIINLGQYLTDFDMGRRVTVLMLMALAGSWFTAYADRSFNLDYYSYLIKVFVWTCTFSELYVGLVQQFNFIVPILIYMIIWAICAVTLRWISNRLCPKLKFLVFGEEAGSLPHHPRVEYCRLDDLSHIDLQVYNAILVDEQMTYPSQWRKLVMHAQAVGLQVINRSRLVERLTGKISIEELNRTWLDNSFVVSWGYMQFKRVMEFLLVLILAPIWLPLCLLISIVIMLTMGWPVVFTQDRVGQHGKIFKIYKFRSMKNGPESKQETQDNDDRITWFGRCLRKYRLDELPQFINVLNGDMSLIGPRPEWQLTAEKFNQEIPAYHIRYLVKPGITGWAQVNLGHVIGKEGNYTKLQYDLYYVRHFSIWLDLKIFLKTIKVLLTGFGAK